MNRRTNPSLAVASPDKLRRLRESYEAWHWGAAPDKELSPAARRAHRDPQWHALP